MTRRRPRSAPAPAPRMTGGWREWAALSLVLAAGAALRHWILTRASGLTMDSPLYVAMAEQLGGPLEPLGPAHHGYPVLVRAASLLVMGREAPGRAVSFAAGMLLIVLTYLIARRRVPVPGALAAAALVALHPLLALSSGALMTESAFQALTYGALLALDAGVVAVAGGILGLAYCVRPEAAVVAVAALPTIAPWRQRALWLFAFAIVAAPEVVALSLERGAFTVTPKTNLIAAAGAARDDAEWLVAQPDTTPASAAPSRRGPGGELAAVLARYPDRLIGQLRRVHESWPAPLLILSVVGAVIRPGPLLAPLAIVLVLPLLGVTPHLRYPQTLVPALAVYAAIGAGWCLERTAHARRVLRMASLVAVVLVMIAGLVWCWRGAAGDAVRKPEDTPMVSARKAGRWLAANGRAGALVMDRKPYVPFFAGLRHALMPNDDYDTIVEHARRTGVDYLVMEEHVMWHMRPQFVPLLTDTAFRAGEHRLRMIYGASDGPMTGMAIFEVVR